MPNHQIHQTDNNPHVIETLGDTRSLSRVESNVANMRLY
jgi:hypothetical protein